MHAIYSQASQAQVLFKRCEEGLQASSITTAAQGRVILFRDLQGRFRSWCGSLGALQLGHASLDYRLRDNNVVQQSVLSFLQDLNTDLEDCGIAIISDKSFFEESVHSPEVCEDDDDDDSEDETSPIGEIDGLLLNLGNTIDGLYQLSFLIRNDRARRSAFRRAETYGKNIGSKGEDLLGYYDSHDRKRAVDFIRDLRSNAGNERDQDFSAEDKLLIDQLAQASSKRRRVFVYLEFHSEKLDTDQSLGQSADPTTQVPLSEPVGLAESRIVGSVTEATSFYPETAAAEAEDDIRSKIFSISTARAFDGTGVSLPKPPKVISGHKEFRCPYCRTWCPEQETKIGQWRRHLFEDVRPYMCTYVGCSSAYELYGSRTDWLNHEKEAHRSTLTCRDHPDVSYNQRDKFLEHMKTQHKGLNEQEIYTASRYSTTTSSADARDQCRLCLKRVAQLRDGQSLANHMAYHFEEYAISSLPNYGDDNEQEEHPTEMRATGQNADHESDSDSASDARSIELDRELDVPSDTSIHDLALTGNILGMRRLLLDEDEDVDQDVDQEDEGGWTALQMAAWGGHRVISQMLLSAGAKINRPGGNYGNALQCAASQGHDRVLRLLIDGGADVNLQGGYFGTSLQAAACHGHKSTVEILLRAGADMSLRGGQFTTALEAAGRNGHNDIVAILDELELSTASTLDVPPRDRDDISGASHLDTGEYQQTVRAGSSESVHVEKEVQPGKVTESSANSCGIPTEGDDLLSAASSGPIQSNAQEDRSSVENAPLRSKLSRDQKLVSQDPGKTNKDGSPVSMIPLPTRDRAKKPDLSTTNTAPWVNSPALGGYYIYLPNTDEIHLRDGRRYPRPTHIPRSFLVAATYNGRMPPPQQQTPQTSFPNTDSPPNSANLLIDQNRATIMNQMRRTHPTQRITGGGSVEVVFHYGQTHSQIIRREPPNINARGVTIDKPEITANLFKAYKHRETPKKFFKIGKVFMVLWSEPAPGTSKVSKWAAGTIINHLGERVFAKVRRFVVIREGGKYCNALPINTYAGRGVSKQGVTKSEHVIIYTGTNPPRPIVQEMPRPGESGMRAVPIQVDPDSRDEMLDPMSRLDLGSITKVEHNIKVKPLGNVNKRYLDALRTQYVNVQRHRASAGPSSVAPQYGLLPIPQAESSDDDDDDDNDDDDDDNDNDDDDDDDEEADDSSDNNNDDDDDDDDDNADDSDAK